MVSCNPNLFIYWCWSNSQSPKSLSCFASLKGARKKSQGKDSRSFPTQAAVWRPVMSDSVRSLKHRVSWLMEVMTKFRSERSDSFRRRKMFRGNSNRSRWYFKIQSSTSVQAQERTSVTESCSNERLWQLVTFYLYKYKIWHLIQTMYLQLHCMRCKVYSPEDGPSTFSQKETSGFSDRIAFSPF